VCDTCQEEYVAPITKYDCKPSDYKYKTDNELLDERPNTGVQWIFKSHTHFSMIKMGKFAEGIDVDEIESKVSGTFGGRFQSLDMKNRRFVYIAYTD
jgi:hypothetical protein